VKLKRDFTFLLHVDQHPDFIVARPAGRASHGVTATLYAPIHSSYSFDNSKVGDRRTVYELKRRKIWLDDRTVRRPRTLEHQLARVEFLARVGLRVSP
jgi:hypothetical protein